jgi:cytochrome c peroxidase
MSLANVAYGVTFGWANPVLTSLERQALVPLLGEEPVELGLSGKEQEMLERLRADARYVRLFRAAYPDKDDPFTLDSVVKAIASFERTLLSGDAPFDRYMSGAEPSALSSAALLGKELFFSERLECFHCHGGFNFADGVDHSGKPIVESAFHNTALYNLDGSGAYPPDNVGLMEFTGRPSDMGRMKAPTLRNVAVTAPYMHDGSVATLREALDHYATGGRTLTGPRAGIGAASPLKSEFLVGFTLTDSEKDAVIAFLESLTDPSFLTGPQWADPWKP